MAKEDVYNVDLLRQLLDYNPETGVLVWRKRDPSLFNGHAAGNASAWNKRYAGKEALCTSSKPGHYKWGAVFNIRVMAHRVAWTVFHGTQIPPGIYIDHINGNPSDNRICNLRQATPRENMANAERFAANARGARFHKSQKKWQASIRIHLGTFDTEAEASAAYEAAARKLHGEFYLPSGKRAPTAYGS